MRGEGPIEFDPLVPDLEIAHTGEAPHRLAVGAHRVGHDSAALLAGEALLATGDGQARRQALDVPLERPGERLVEVVEVEQECGDRAPRSRRSWTGERRRRAASMRPESGPLARSAAIKYAAPRKKANGDAAMRGSAAGRGSARARQPALPAASIGSARSPAGVQSRCSDRGSPGARSLPARLALAGSGMVGHGGPLLSDEVARSLARGQGCPPARDGGCQHHCTVPVRCGALPRPLPKEPRDGRCEGRRLDLLRRHDDVAGRGAQRHLGLRRDRQRATSSWRTSATSSATSTRWAGSSCIIALIQLIAAFSIWAGGEFGRWIGIFGASISAIGALLSIPGYPLWSVCVFFVDVLIIYGLAAYGGQAHHRDRAAH